MIETIQVDGSNIAFDSYTYKNGKKIAKSSNLIIVIKYLNGIIKEFGGIKLLVYVDASLKYNIDNRQWLESQIRRGKILQCPARIPADIFILNYLVENPDNTVVISNDLFKEYTYLTDCLKTGWRYHSMIINGEIIIPRLKIEIKNGLYQNTQENWRIKTEFLI